jgi:hypothetical protein
MNVNIYQIFYDEITRTSLDPGFIPLDNRDPQVKGWYEFWPILNFLNNQKLDEGSWYGFLSPKFESKIGLRSEDLVEMIEQNSSRADVLLLSPEWDQISYFINVFEQGELCHPGLTSLSQNFLDSAGIEIKLDRSVMDSSNSVFSNYIIAKKDYWERWREYANLFFEYVNLRSEYNKEVGGIFYSTYPMKAFIQERLASIVLTKTAFPTINIDQSEWGPVNTLLFEDNQETRKLLRECNELKSKYRRTGNGLYLSQYWDVRSKVNIKDLSFQSKKHNE